MFLKILCKRVKLLTMVCFRNLFFYLLGHFTSNMLVFLLLISPSTIWKWSIETAGTKSLQLWRFWICLLSLIIWEQHFYSFCQLYLLNIRIISALFFRLKENIFCPLQSSVYVCVFSRIDCAIPLITLCIWSLTCCVKFRNSLMDPFTNYMTSLITVIL